MTAPFTGGGVLAGAVARAVGPVVARLVNQFGSDVTIYRATSIRQPDASTIRKWAPIAVGVRLQIANVAVEPARRVWGSEKAIVAEGIAPVGLDLTQDDGLEVTAGPFMGQRFLVGGTSQDPVAGMLFVGLVNGPREAFEVAP